ncbi:Pkinase-domain-containing protein [Martensiomyces pterosporus]|nr:Pkinase-domain-containing protein [Martensiomyces pterosporus]
MAKAATTRPVELLKEQGRFTCTDGVSVPAVFVDTRRSDESYRVVSLLGRGAFGRCYEVQNGKEPAKGNWACKTIDKASFKSQKVVERVKYEIKVMRRLPSHDNIVALHHIFEDEERVYILMELCTSRTLHDLLQKRKQLTEFEARYFTAQLASGLTALHGAHIIHRDIKHSNLLLDSMNRIKIADFGLSTILSVDSDRKLSFLGTPNFLAPELVTRSGQGHSFGVDVWAAGVLLFVMLYGRPPFNVQRASTKVNLQLLYHRIVGQDIEYPSEPTVSETAKDLVDKLCCKNEDDRIRASQISTEPWFLVHADSSVPKSMPGAIFDRPIRNLQEYKEFTLSDPRSQLHLGPHNGPHGCAHDSLRPVVSKLANGTHTSNGLGRRNGLRQPLEPIPENEIRPKAGGRPSEFGTASAATHTRRQALALAPAEKENHDAIERQVEKAGLSAKLATQPAHGYSLRSRSAAVKPAYADKKGAQEDWPHRPASTRSLVRAPESLQALDAGEALRRHGQPMQCQVKAEFGRVTKLSEEYIPSILSWKDRLRRFCEQTESYLQRSSSDLEAEIGQGADTAGLASPQGAYPRVGMYVINWMVLTKYGLGFRLSDGTMGTLFNDNTSLLDLNETDEYVYVRPYENRCSIGHYSKANFPQKIEKKRWLLNSFSQKIKKTFSAGIDRDICPEPGGDLVRCLLQALSTNVGMVFLLTGNVLQFNMLDHSKLFLYMDAHIFYKSASGEKWHFDLREGPAMLIRDSAINIEQFLLCLSYAQKVLASWNLPQQPSQKGC